MVAISKLAFMVWGVGLPGLDFTGLSGHSAMAALVWPALLGLLAGRGGRVWRLCGATLGTLLAAAVAWSRVALHAHSASEVVLGFALGAAFALWLLWRHGREWRLAWSPASRAAAAAAGVAVRLRPPLSLAGHAGDDRQALGRWAAAHAAGIASARTVTARQTVGAHPVRERRASPALHLAATTTEPVVREMLWRVVSAKNIRAQGALLRSAHSSWQAGGLALRGKQGDCLFVERYEGFATKPLTLEGDHAVGEVAAGFEYGQAGFGGWPVRFRVRCIEQCPDRTSHIRRREAVHAAQHPDQLA